MKPGRPPDIRKLDYGINFNLTPAQQRKISLKILDQLDRCRDDSARPLILGKGRKS